ncbi:DNA cytosine methyltransferase [Acidimicrobiaceae bacterium]|nr:DNA cytosine methyltransferase [Acidimicrobiaceae bacterium]
MTLTAIDLFSGPGGMTIGMRAAGFSPIMGVEFKRDAVATYRSHTDSDHRLADIRSVDFIPFRQKADVVFGGPPCQPFSLGGLRQGSGDDRDMVPEFVRAVREIEPAAFVMENVPGLLTKKYASYFSWIMRELASLGFICSYRIINASDYGAPQSRRRVFMVGMRGMSFRFPSPTHGETPLSPKVVSSLIVGPDPFGEPPKSPVVYAPKVDLRPNPYHGHVFMGGGRPIDPDAPCQTIYAAAGGNKTHWVDTESIVPEYHAHLKRGGKPRHGVVPGARRLSVEESALIQTFPRDLQFSGSRSSQYTQVGDAVPPVLAQALGEALRAQLTGDASDRALLPDEPEQTVLAL